MERKYWEYVGCMFVVCLFGMFRLTYANDLTVESIIDSSALLEKIKQPDNSLHPYFDKNAAPVTRADIVAVLNEKVLPDENFLYVVTNDESLKNLKSFEEMNADQQEAVLASNRDLLSELFPLEIAPLETGTVKQGFGIKINIKKPDSTLWFKAEVVTFLNEVITCRKNLEKWENLRQFFDDNVNDEEIKALAESLLLTVPKRIPINSLALEYDEKEKTAEILLTGKKDRKKKKLLTLSFYPGDTWKITNVKNLQKDLLGAGYIENKRD